MPDVPSLYTKKVMEHFKNPRNVGDMENPDGTGRATSPAHGDTMELYIRVSRDIITDVRFKTFGCGAAIATGSIVTEMLKGRTIEEARRLSNHTVVEELGGLPPDKIHCSVLAEEAVISATDDYLSKSKGGQNGGV